ncbi:M56 family metallopeptidase [Kitasatospora sp. NPDC049285]|uniref:M56 family metallopeptidase n=1 Tax=Kitasatospora sp. NPDC049285 TaxID=3157096 RepID=UPI00342B1740
MTLAVWAPLLLPLLAVPLARRVAELLAPRAAALTLAVTAVALGTASLASLGLLTLTGLLHLPYPAALARLSPAHWHPAAIPHTAAAAALALLAITGLAVRTAHRQRRDLRRARRALGDAPPAPPATRLRELTRRTAALLRRATGRPDADAPSARRGVRPRPLGRLLRAPARRPDPAGFPLAVLPDHTADAYALPGRPPRIVATAGMLAALSGPERAALLAHERAHLAGRHHVLLAAAEYAAACHPALRPLRGALGYHLERWADECAAAEVGDRALTARAIGRAALAASAAPGRTRPGLAPAAHTGPVPRRVLALLSPRPAHRPTTRTLGALALATCLALAATTAVEATHDLHQEVEIAQGDQPAGR